MSPFQGCLVDVFLSMGDAHRRRMSPFQGRVVGEFLMGDAHRRWILLFQGWVVGEFLIDGLCPSQAYVTLSGLFG